MCVFKVPLARRSCAVSYRTLKLLQDMSIILAFTLSLSAHRGLFVPFMQLSKYFDADRAQGKACLSTSLI